VGYKEEVKRAALVTLPALALLTSRAFAAPPATEAQRHEIRGEPARPPTYTILDLTASEATAQLKKIAAWDVTMQATTCTEGDAGADAGLDASYDASFDAGPDAAYGTCDIGGIIEVESGPGRSIVASDNTQETIGLWSINQKLNDVAYASNIADAFKFLSTHEGYDAWKLAGDPGPDYYSVYNCGWGVRAVMLYEAETGDTAHHDYGVKCASHIAANASSLIPFGDVMHVGPAAWAASGLWAWGDTYDDAASKTAAVAIGTEVKTWIEAAPAERLTSDEWAMTGAAPFYGVVETYMKEHPTELVPWVTEYAPKLGGWIDESMPATPNDWTDWRNAWAAWNMLAHFTAAQVLGTKAGLPNARIAMDILTKLVAQENAKTDAIAGSEQRPSTQAESWITAYMVYFGLLQIIEAPSSDAGVEGGIRDAGTRADTAAPPPAKDASPPPRDATADASTPASPEGGCSCVLAGDRTGNLAPFGALASLAWLLAARRRAAKRRD
jgi:hypothetical protein